MTMCQALRAFFIGFTYSSIMSLPAHAGTQDADAQRCAALKETTDSSIRITASKLQAQGRLTAGGGTSALTGGAENAAAVFPAHCLVRGEIKPYTGADGKPYATRFEMRLPHAWYNRLLFQGGGGLDGVVNPAIGAIAVLGSQAQSALKRGFAVVSMDGGHTGNNADFAADQQAKLNFAYGAIGQVTAASKHLIAAFYTKAPDKTYFMGCSNGGREALIAAQRYPSDFDGIVAGDPAFNLGNASMLSHHGLATFAKIAPRGNDGLGAIAQKPDRQGASISWD